MNRDNALFIVIGLLVGFIAGYLLQEVMVERQPQRLVHGDDSVVAGGPGANPNAPNAPAAGGGEGGGQVTAPGVDARVQNLMEQKRNLETYLASNPEDAEAQLRLGTVAIELNDWPGCVRSLERYVDLRSETPDLLSDLGICYRGVDRIDRALELFDRAQEIEPDHWQSRFNEAMVLGLDRGDFDAADRVIEELRALRPDDPQVDRLAQEIERRRPA